MLTRKLVHKFYFSQHPSKVVSTIGQALKGIKNGSHILVGGFGLCGVPMNLIGGIKQLGIKDLTLYSNNCGVADVTGKKDWGLAVLLRTHQIKRMVTSYGGENTEFQRQYLGGELEFQITPQGTLAQKIKSGGAGIPAFYTATGVGTMVQEGGFAIKLKKGTTQPQIIAPKKNTKVFNGKKYIEEQTIFAQFAIIKAQKADTMGNLYFNKSARNFNPDMATAATCVIAQVQQIVEPGQLQPQDVHVPSVYVDRIYKSDPLSPWSQKKIQKVMLTKEQSEQQQILSQQQQKRLKIIRRAAKQVKNGMYINIGVGIPTLLPTVLHKDVKVDLECQNGFFGVGPYPKLHQVDPDLINAGKVRFIKYLQQTATSKPGASFFASSQSFSIIRGGHLDLTILGAFQVSQSCDIANWIIPNHMVKGMGGAMDLVSCGSRVIIAMQHTCLNKKNNQLQQKVVRQCTLPLTGKGVVSMLVTQLAVFENIEGKLVLKEIAQNTTLEEVQAKTGFNILIEGQVKRF